MTDKRDNQDLTDTVAIGDLFDQLIDRLVTAQSESISSQEILELDGVIDLLLDALYRYDRKKYTELTNALAARNDN